MRAGWSLMLTSTKKQRPDRCESGQSSESLRDNCRKVAYYSFAKGQWWAILLRLRSWSRVAWWKPQKYRRAVFPWMVKVPQCRTEKARFSGTPQLPFSPVHELLLEAPRQNGYYEEHKSFGESGSWDACGVHRADWSKPCPNNFQTQPGIAMGKLTAEGVINSLANSRCIPEPVPVQVSLQHDSLFRTAISTCLAPKRVTTARKPIRTQPAITQLLRSRSAMT